MTTLPSEFIAQTGSKDVPSWVVENESRKPTNRGAPTQKVKDDSVQTENVEQIEPSQNTIVYLLDGPTYPIADGGSAIKAALLEGLATRGLKIRLIAAKWPSDHPNAYNHIGTQVSWIRPEEYFSTDRLRRLLTTLKPRLVIVDSVETLRRCATFLLPRQILAVYLDDYSKTIRDRQPNDESENVNSMTNTLLAEGMDILWRGPEGRDRLSTSSNSGRIFSFDGISLAGSKRRTLIHHHAPTVIVGNFRYPPNRLGLDNMLQHFHPGEYRLSVVGDVPQCTNERLAARHIRAPGIVSNVGPWITNASVGLDPVTVGSGISTKLLTYARYGTPVVCTRFASRGIHPDVSSKFTIVEHVRDVPNAVENVQREYLRQCQAAEEARLALATHHDIAVEIDIVANAIAKVEP